VQVGANHPDPLLYLAGFAGLPRWIELPLHLLRTALGLFVLWKLSVVVLD